MSELMNVMERIEAAVLARLPEVETTRSEGKITFTAGHRNVILEDAPSAEGRLIVAGPNTVPPLPVDLNKRFDSEALERGARLITERLTSPFYDFGGSTTVLD